MRNSKEVKKEEGKGKWRKAKDVLAQAVTYLFSSFSLISLIALLVFVFSKGWTTLSWDFLFGSNRSEITHIVTASSAGDIDTGITYSYEPREGEYFSSKWGLAFMDGKDLEGNPTVVLSYVDPQANVSQLVDHESGEAAVLKVGSRITSVQLWSDSNGDDIYIVSGSEGAEKVCSAFEKCTYLRVLNLSYGGGGIRGAVISTLYVILFSMLFALPLGIAAAIYLALFAKHNKFTEAIKTLIDMISGIPSIIFGLVGGAFFLPISNNGNGTLITASLTLACMILPTIIKSTEESILAVPPSYRSSSLALGASDTQTVFKVVLPNALPGILTSVLLGVGRVIGESAALIYTSGTAIQDYVVPNQGSATLSVYIWSLMSGETQNYEASCAISILILIIIFILSILVKLISYFTEKRKGDKRS